MRAETLPASVLTSVEHLKQNGPTVELLCCALEADFVATSD